jgi:hypothetical protein
MFLAGAKSPCCSLKFLCDFVVFENFLHSYRVLPITEFVPSKNDKNLKTFKSK